MPSPSAAPAAPSDGYLDGLSPQSLEVLAHFGTESPAILNQYACVVEDALLNQAQQTADTLKQLQGAHTVIQAAAEDNAALRTILTNPKLLAQYTNEFFGPQGPYPVETARDRLAAEVRAGEAAFNPAAAAAFAQRSASSARPIERQAPPAAAPQPQLQPPRPAQQSYERPRMDVPAPGPQQGAGGGDALSIFSAMFAKDPARAAAYLHQAVRPEDLRSRQWISE
jgi:hypothetical protein